MNNFDNFARVSEILENRVQIGDTSMGKKVSQLSIGHRMTPEYACRCKERIVLSFRRKTAIAFGWVEDGRAASQYLLSPRDSFLVAGANPGLRGRACRQDKMDLIGTNPLDYFRQIFKGSLIIVDSGDQHNFEP